MYREVPSTAMAHHLSHKLSTPELALKVCAIKRSNLRFSRKSAVISINPSVQEKARFKNVITFSLLTAATLYTPRENHEIVKGLLH